MNGPFQIALSPSYVVPEELKVLRPEPLLLPGESREQYDALQSIVLGDIAPRSAIECLLAFDVAELSWEIRRYRSLRHKLLKAFRHRAVEMALSEIDLVGIDERTKGVARARIAKNVLDWRVDPKSTGEIDRRLLAYGFDQTSISMEVYLQVREQYAFFEGLIHSASFHRISLLREISRARSSKTVNPPQ
ncbi:hypothetical protein JQ580_32635 [Bradyrhizobium japonicum]|uniref:hypothetical protein n=1 Tax=Bradyrhizobium japonicum TaxID=375 RepID=UPI001BAC415E|nr:hypothetical protein [Bradyrhizobium japonicum]MBR0995470.1 hypothetical protein [Bradyrhizobium japonicum]